MRGVFAGIYLGKFIQWEYSDLPITFESTREPRVVLYIRLVDGSLEVSCGVY